MTGETGTLIASGRAADVYDLGDGTVLRRSRTEADTGHEARVMNWLADQGLPVPRIRRASGRDMVMDLVVGVTMLDDLGRCPWRLARHARSLARLQQAVNAVTAPDWFPRRMGVPEGDAVLHLDFHPMNVIVDRDAATIIDWTNASAGPAGFDAAMSDVLARTTDVTAAVDRLGRRLFLAAFVSVRGRATIEHWCTEAASYRLRDPNVTDTERARLIRLIADGRRSDRQA